LVLKAKPLFLFFHQHESRYGELSSIQKLESRMKELYPDDPKLFSFSQRFVSDNFDPTAIRPIISPSTQARPKIPVVQSVEVPTIRQSSPPVAAAAAAAAAAATVPAHPIAVSSPKRPAPLDDFESDVNRPRKVARGESPLAGAAGRRLNQMRQVRQPFENTPSAAQSGGYPAPPPPLPRDITFLLSIIPPASTYNTIPFNAERMVEIIRDTPIPSSVDKLPGNQRPPSRALNNPGPPHPQPYPQGGPNYYTGIIAHHTTLSN
jgi:cleavage stimulation factor subunit 3